MGNSTGKSKVDEEKLRIKMDELKEKLGESQAQLDLEKKKTADHQKSLELAKQQSESLESKVKMQKYVSPFKRGCTSCMDAIFPKERIMQKHQKLLEDHLGASHSATDNLAAKRRELEAKVELQEMEASIAPQTNSWAASQQAAAPLFSRNVSFWRSKTPAQQRDMKFKIQELLQDLQTCEEEMEAERKNQRQAEIESLHHQVSSLVLENDMRTQMRIDAGLDNQLKDMVNCDDRDAKHIATSFRTIFKDKTPARQRDMKEQIKAFYADLMEAEKEFSEEHGAIRQRGQGPLVKANSQNTSPNNFAFAFKAPPAQTR